MRSCARKRRIHFRPSACGTRTSRKRATKRCTTYSNSCGETMPAYDDDKLERTVQIPIDGLTLEGTLGVPRDALGVVLFAHGSGSSRFSPRNRLVARVLRDAGLG